MSTATLHSRRHLIHLHEPPSPLDGGGRLLRWRYNEFDDHNFQIHGHTILYLFILFAVVLLATLLLLYARWFFRLPRPSSVPLPNPNHPRPHLHPRPVPKGLDFATINSLPITLHVSSDVADDGMLHDLECCICLAAFEDGDKVKVLPGCNHRYHSTCVDTWLSGHSSCPLCRLSIQVDSSRFDGFGSDPGFFSPSLNRAV